MQKPHGDDTWTPQEGLLWPALMSLGWRAGAQMSKVDIMKLELRVMENCNPYSWAAIGGTATAGVKPSWVTYSRSQTGWSKSLTTSAPVDRIRLDPAGKAEMRFAGSQPLFCKLLGYCRVGLKMRDNT